MRSLKEDDFSLSKESARADEERDITPFQLRRRWEGRYDLCTPACRDGICNPIRYLSQNWVCNFVFPSLIIQPTSLHLFQPAV